MSGPIGSILIPTDDSEGALAGARLGIALAASTGAKIHVLTVMDLPMGQATEEIEAARQTLEEQAEDAVERVAELAGQGSENIRVTTTVASGTPFQSIREYAHRHEIDVIVMGTKGRTGLDRVLLGSVTENVLRTARTPVLAVPPAADIASVDPITVANILLPTDGSEGAEIATTWGIALASEFDGMVHAVYSVDASRFPEVVDPGELIGSLEANGKEVIEAVRVAARDAGVSVSGSVASGQPTSVILDVLETKDIDLIVMGTHGRTGVGQWFLGSVTENVVRQATVPVLCIPVTAAPPRDQSSNPSRGR